MTYSGAFGASSPETFSKAVADYRQGRHAAALNEFLLLIARDPSAEKTQEAIHYVWEIAGQIKKSEQELALDPRRWRQSVEQAKQVAAHRRQDARQMLRQVESLASQLPGAKAPLDSLRRAPLFLGALKPSDMDELSRLKADQYVATIRQALKEAINKQTPDLAELHEIKGYFWLYQGDLELALQEWREAMRLKPSDELGSRVEKIKETWDAQKRAEEAQHQLQLGISELRTGHYQQAYLKIQKAAATDPDNEETQQYLELSKKGMENASRQEKLQSLLVQGRDQYQKGHLLESVQSWVDILVLDPSNEEARRQLERVRRRLLLIRTVQTPSIKPPPKPAPSEPEDEILAVQKAEESYSLGLIFYNDGELKKARDSFSETLHWQPAHSKAKKALEQVEAELKNQ